eukprot:Sspe_Gene.21871::Locus_8241_Transcript_1_1_Confidence_1.000_Length_1432::g.21871::m.21871
MVTLTTPPDTLLLRSCVVLPSSGRVADWRRLTPLHLLNLLHLLELLDLLDLLEVLELPLLRGHDGDAGGHCAAVHHLVHHLLLLGVELHEVARLIVVDRRDGHTSGGGRRGEAGCGGWRPAWAGPRAPGAHSTQLVIGAPDNALNDHVVIVVIQPVDPCKVNLLLLLLVTVLLAGEHLVQNARRAVRRPPRLVGGLALQEVGESLCHVISFHVHHLNQHVWDVHRLCVGRLRGPPPRELRSGCRRQGDHNKLNVVGGSNAFDGVCVEHVAGATASTSGLGSTAKSEHGATSTFFTLSARAFFFDTTGLVSFLGAAGSEFFFFRVVVAFTAGTCSIVLACGALVVSLIRTGGTPWRPASHQFVPVAQHGVYQQTGCHP